MQRSRAVAWVAACVAWVVVLAPASRAQEGEAVAGGAQEGTQAQGEAEQAERQQPAAPVVVRIDVGGNQRYSAEEIAAALGQPVGAPLDPERVRRGVETLWSSYRARSEVSMREVPGGVELRVDIEEQAFDPAPRFIGHARVDLEEIFEWAGLERDSEVYLYQAPRIRRQVLAGYRAKGFHFAEVDHVVRPGGDGVAPDVIFEIREGPRVKVREVVLHGNESVPDRGGWIGGRGLRKEANLELKAPFVFGWFPRYYDEQVLSADVVALREVYRNRGFWDAVVQLERLEFDEDREWVTIHLAIDEGERYRITDLRIEAYELVADPDGRGRAVERPSELVIPEAELLALCEQQPGTYYAGYDTERDIAALRRRYGAIGHIQHGSLPQEDRWTFLGVEPTFDVERKEVALVYRVAQGRQQFLREIQIAGNLHTRDRVIRRLVSVFPGEIADLTRIDRSLARIRGTGYFSNEFRPQEHEEPSYRFVATDSPNWKDLEFMLEEGNVLRFEFGVQVGSDNGLQGFAELQLRNFDASRPPSLDSPLDDIRNRDALHGLGQTLQLRVTPGTEESTYSLRFTEPDLFRRHIDRIGATVGIRRSLRRYDSHDERRTGFDLELFRQLDFDTRASVGFEATEVRVSDLDVSGEGSLVDPLGVPGLLFEQLGDTQVNGLSLGVSRNKLDNAFNPREGYTLAGSLTFFDELLGSDHEFAKLEGNWKLYGHFGGRESGPGLRLLGRTGVAVPYGDDDDVPYTERYFLGGSSLRGFEFRGVGPDENGHPIGGETFAAGTVEWLYPLVSEGRPGSPELYDVIRGGFFLDAGLTDPEPFRLDPSEVRASVGVTVSFLVPLPITLSFGLPVLDKDSDRTQVFHFTIGTL